MATMVSTATQHLPAKRRRIPATDRNHCALTGLAATAVPDLAALPEGAITAAATPPPPRIGCARASDACAAWAARMPTPSCNARHVHCLMHCVGCLGRCEQETRMDPDKLNPQKPGISQPPDDQKQPHPRQPERGGSAQEPQPRKPDNDDKSRQVPIEGE
jgi:hypothetical protein